MPVDERIDQIIANMERWRWLPAALPADRIQVNIAAAILTLFHGDAPVLSMRAVTGRPGDETPMLQSQIQSDRAQSALERALRHRRQGAVAQGAGPSRLFRAQ